MKALILVGSIVALSGCAVYPAPYAIHGGASYHSGPSPRVHDRGHDGGSDRFDRDGDGVPNRWDAQPSNPRRR